MFTLYMYDVAIDPQTPSTLYVGTEAEGIFKSVNGGLSWNAVNDGLPDTIVYTLAIDPQTPSSFMREPGMDSSRLPMAGGELEQDKQRFGLRSCGSHRD